MEKKLKVWSVIGVFIAFAIGGGWHFVYDALPINVLGVIAPVNESPWEHAKLFFVPALLWYLVLYFIAGRRFPNFVFAHSVSLLMMPALMLLLYSAYHSFFEETLPLDLANSFVTFAAGAWLAFRLTVSDRNFSGTGYKAAAALIVLALLVTFAAFTYWPLHASLFWDSENLRFGLPSS